MNKIVELLFLGKIYHWDYNHHYLLRKMEELSFLEKRLISI